MNFLTDIIKDRELLLMVGSALALLIVASVIGFILKKKGGSESQRRVVENLVSRTNAWWIMVGVFVSALLMGPIALAVLFALLSFMALREFITLTPTRRGDHRALFWAFFVILPVHYLILASQWYGLFSIFIPVYAFLFMPLRTALAGETESFLERTAKVQWGLMICVYCASHAPALMMLQIPGYEGENAKLLFFFVFIVQLSDVLQYVWGKTLGKTPIVPQLSPNKTWAGFMGGILSTTAVGAALWWATPFQPWQAALMAFAIVLMGFAGGLVMSAIKRDRGVKDYGASIPGHGGVMDRIDSLCYAAPVFFHLTRYFFTP
jgi:phosphatidate cytidylyltransferase